MSYLLDTNVLSELRKGQRAAPRVLEWYETIRPQDRFVSVVTAGEIRRGIERLRPRDEVQARALERWLGRLLTTYADRVLAVDLDIADRWGRLSAGASLPVVDTLLAATALVRGLTLATRNTRDVSRTGVAVVNPFTRSA